MERALVVVVVLFGAVKEQTGLCVCVCVPQGDLPSPSDSRFYSRLLSSDYTEDLIDADEYLLPYNEQSNHGNHPCRAMVNNNNKQFVLSLEQ